MTNEEIIARFQEMERKQTLLEEENRVLKLRAEEIASSASGMAGGLAHTPDTTLGEFRNVQFARRVTLATRPVVDQPGDYPNATFHRVKAPSDVQVTPVLEDSYGN